MPPDIGIGLVGQAQGRQQFVGAALTGRHAIIAGLDLQRFARGEEDVGTDFLDDDAERGPGPARVPVDVAAPDQRLAAGLVHDPGQNVDQRRLAGPIRPQKAEDGAARNHQIEPLQGRLGR
jgi:hypothetical protein